MLVSSVARAALFGLSRDLAAIGQLSLVYQIGEKYSWHHGYCRHFVHAGRVAPIPIALADKGVVLLEHGSVALTVFTLVPDVSTATDDTLISTNLKNK